MRLGGGRSCVWTRSRLRHATACRLSLDAAAVTLALMSHCFAPGHTQLGGRGGARRRGARARPDDISGVASRRGRPLIYPALSGRRSPPPAGGGGCFDAEAGVRVLTLQCHPVAAAARRASTALQRRRAAIYRRTTLYRVTSAYRCTVLNWSTAKFNAVPRHISIPLYCTKPEYTDVQ